MDLYYDHPASIWEETLPIGNGKLGGMIWGGVQEELIGLNEESLWSGYEREKDNPLGRHSVVDWKNVWSHILLMLRSLL